MCWSFSRDHGLPLSRVWAHINPYVGVPVNAVWFMVTFAFLLGLPMLKSAVAFSAVVSISTIGLYISYAIPIFLRITTARKDFVKGAFHLGFMSYPIAVIAVLWVAFITVSYASELPAASGFEVLAFTTAGQAVLALSKVASRRPEPTFSSCSGRQCAGWVSPTVTYALLQWHFFVS